MDSVTAPRFSLARTIKLGLFNLGSAMADILTASVWNRVVITDLGAGAAPVSIVLGLRYLMAPAAAWIGMRSDTRPIFGWRRLPYIWLGRLFMLIGILLLPMVTLRLAADPSDALAWALAAGLFMFYGLGTAVSGGPYLALVHDSAPPAKRGLAAGVTQIIFIAGFAIFGSLYGALLRSYSAEQLQRLAWITGIGAGLLWLVSVLGEERRTATPRPASPVADDQPGFRDTLRGMWADRRARLFFAFLTLGAISAFAQDAVLEPFGGDVFGLSLADTTRFSTYWGTGILIAMIVTSILTRHRRPEQQFRPAQIGMSVMIVGFAWLALAGLSGSSGFVVPALVVVGLGFGAYTIGGFGLIMAMTTEARAGAYLGLWTMTQLVARGLGIGLGGVVRDVMLGLTGSVAIAYASVFLLEAAGLAVCIGLLARLDVAGFARQHQPEAAPSSVAPAD